ncbi:MAG TPA: methyltransferase domain-containing protein [Dehalococcoidia bacterium]|nr:methyltransferase domain-containing protein [Dehalococcoidia bacterium]
MTQSSTDTPQDETLTTDRIDKMAFAASQSGVLIAALELDLFTAISEGFNEPAKFAERTKVPVDSVDRLMSACVGLKLIEKEDGKFFNTPDVDAFLVKGKTSYCGDFFTIQPKVDYNVWNDIVPSLRQSVPENKKPNKGYYFEDSQSARDYAVALYNLRWKGAQRFARRFDFSSYSLFLDLGGGAGTYSIAAAQEHSHLRAIVFDYANVIPVAEEYIQKAGVSDRVKTVSGDFLDTEFPGGADLAAYITCLQVYGPEDVQFLVNKAFNALVPGGGLIIIDYMMNEDKTGHPGALFCHLYQKCISPENPGYVNTPTEFRDYLMKAGFVDILAREPRYGPMGFVFGKKPR